MAAKAVARNGKAATEQVEKAAVAHKSLAEALLAAQMEMPAVEPDATNPHFKSRYVTLGNLLAKTRPVLNRHGMALVQLPTLDEEGRFVLRTEIEHVASGEKLEFDSPLSPTKNDPQGQGSAITYMRRYSLAAALAIADQEDDDGNAASENDKQQAPQTKAEPAQRSVKPITGAQKGKINGLLSEAGLTEVQAQAVKQWWAARNNAQFPDRLSSKAASDLIDHLGPDGSGAREILAGVKTMAERGDEVAVALAERLAADEEAHGA